MFRRRQVWKFQTDALLVTCSGGALTMIGKPLGVDWRTVLRSNAPFSQLSDETLNELIQQDAQEMSFAPGETIVEEGELSEHLYVLGRGSASVILSRSGGRVVRLATLKIGEMFGEMGLIEEKPRVATVIAEDHCLLLQIDGRRFLARLRASPDLEFRMLLAMSERLRNRTEHIFVERLFETDDRLTALSGQLETELRISEATKQATQAMFDETHKRASEVIQSFQRMRDYFTWIGSALSAFVFIVVTIVGFFGFDTYFDAKEVIESVQKLQTRAEELKKDLDAAGASQDEEARVILSEQNKRIDSDLKIILEELKKRQ